MVGFKYFLPSQRDLFLLSFLEGSLSPYDARVKRFLDIVFEFLMGIYRIPRVLYDRIPIFIDQDFLSLTILRFFP